MLGQSNGEYMILLRELDKYETDVLFEHTRRRRHGLQGDKEREPSPGVASKARSVDSSTKNATDRPETDEEIVCNCGKHHNDGYLVQCDACRNWQHKTCYYPNEADRVPEYHYCFDCQKEKAGESQSWFLNPNRSQSENVED
jgi:hypothetical protein